MIFANILATFAIFIQLAFAAHVISNSSLDCSENNGQIIRMDWTACSGPRYNGLTATLAPTSDNPPHYYINQTANTKIASICIRDQFAEADVFLDNGKYSYNQQRVYIETEFDQAGIKIASHSYNEDGSIKELLPVFVPIRSAEFSLGGRGSADQPILSSSSDESVAAYNGRPPNQAINIIYC
jgi:hypothetical protein